MPGHLEYLEYPVQVRRMNLEFSPNRRLNGMAGPNVAFKLDAEPDVNAFLFEDDAEERHVRDLNVSAGLLWEFSAG